MLKIAQSCQRVFLGLGILNKRNSKLLALISSLLSLTFSMAPAEAVTAQLGVIKTKENAAQWEEITKRLRETGVDYCIVDASKWQDVNDFGGIRVLLMPNVDSINRIQANALEIWMSRGGRAIVTGPTGNLSQPEIREQLRLLLGAYWAYSNSFPITLEVVGGELVPNQPQALTNNFVGGTLFPLDSNSRPAATWITEERLPAILVSDRAIHLGWRWGTRNVTSISFDSAWLEAALNRYGISRYNNNNNLSVVEQSQPVECRESSPLGSSNPEEGPRLPNQQNRNNNFPGQPLDGIKQLKPVSAPHPEEFVAPESYSVQGLGLSPERVTAMTQELEGLIARFESTLLAAEASNSNLSLSPKVLREQSVDNGDAGQNSLSPSILENANASRDGLAFTKANTTNSWSHRAVAEARERLQQFQVAIAQKDYAQARSQWIAARRTLWDNYPTTRRFAQPEIRAMWLDRGTIVKARSEADLVKIFDNMAQAGINTVFFETINAGYPIYPSRVAPEQNPLTKGWDPLKASVKLAHERGIELHAWVWTFAAANQRHNQILNQPIDYLGPVLSRHPNWAISDRKGNVFDFGSQYRKAFLDPANPEVQRYLLALLDEIVTQYDVDGIHLDYIRYPFQDPNRDRTFGYSDISRSQFKQITGVDPIEISPSHPLWSQWTAYRLRQVDNFVATASERLKQKRADLTLSVAVFSTKKNERLSRIQQNWEEWGKKGWVDAIVLMTYALDTVNLEDTTQFLLDPSVAGSSLLIPGLRLLSVPDSVTFDQIQYLRNLPTSGYALFATENFTSNLQSVFRRTQGANGKPEPLPHRQPFQATASRYQALQREWSYLLANDRLLMDAVTLKEWGTEVDSLSAALIRLAEQPSPANLITARQTLANFRQRFDRWMSQQKTTQPYQVQAWENRLQGLDSLLNYGERVAFKTHGSQNLSRQ